MRHNVDRIPIHKPTDNRVVVSALQIIEPDFTVVIVGTVAEGVQVADEASLFHYTTISTLCQI